MSNNLSFKELGQVSMIAYLFLWLNEDLGLNFLAVNVRSSFRKCHIRRSFLPYYSNSVFNFAQTILFAEDTNFRPVDYKEISGGDRFLLDRLKTFLIKNLPSKLNPYKTLYLCPDDHWFVYQALSISLYYRANHFFSPPHLELLPNWYHLDKSEKKHSVPSGV